MSTININVNNQRMMLVSSNYKIVSGSQQFVRFHFTLDDDWQNLTVFAQFTQNDDAYNQYLDANYDVFLPSEIEDGEVRVSLYGTGNTVIGTSNYLAFNVEKIEFTEDASSTVITPSLYNQMVEKVGSKVSLPEEDPNGTSGQVLRTNGDGTTQWVAAGTPTDQQTSDAIAAWLAAHPEATTTVADGSIGMSKFTSELQDDLEHTIDLIDGVDYSAILRRVDSVTVPQSGAYSYQDFYTYTGSVSEGDFYAITAKSVVGATATSPFAIYLYAGNTIIRTVYDDHITLSSDDITANVDKILFGLYPARGDALSSSGCVFTDVYVFKGSHYPITLSGDLHSAVTSAVFEPYNVPDYYFENDYLSGKVYAINELLKEASDSFIFITDEHWGSNTKKSPALINYISTHCHIPKLFSGGDTGEGVDISLCDELRKSFNGKIYHVCGNHDWFNNTTVKQCVTAMDVYNDDQIGNVDRRYYYVDNRSQKIRYVVLNAYKTNNTTDYDTAQTNWFKNIALNVPVDWDVIVVTHYIGMKTFSNGDAQGICNAIIAFNNETGRNGKVLAVFQGHMHSDAINHISTNGVPVISTTCDKAGAWIDGGVNQEPYLTATRIPGTISEQAFDVVIISKTISGSTRNVKISLIRIGAKAMDNVDLNFGEEGFTTTGTLESRTINLSYSYNSSIGSQTNDSADSVLFSNAISDILGKISITDDGNGNVIFGISSN